LIRPSFAILAGLFLSAWSAIPSEGAAPSRSPSDPLFAIVGGCLNGHVPTRTLIDTGAAVPFVLLLSPTLARQAHISSDQNAAFRSSGDVGAAVSIAPAAPDSFEIGSVAASAGTAGVSGGVEQASRGLRIGFDSVVGYEFLKDKIVAFDLARRRIAFLAGSPAAVKRVSFTLAPRRPLILLPILINARGPFTAAFDTAAESNLISPEAAQIARLVPGAKAAITGAGGREDGWRTSADVRIVGLGAGEEQMVASASVDRVGREAGTRIDAVLGISNLRIDTFVIDYPGKVSLVPADRRALPRATSVPMIDSHEPARSPRC
jgi:hypothetical protein